VKSLDQSLCLSNGLQEIAMSKANPMTKTLHYHAYKLSGCEETDAAAEGLQ